MNRRAYLAAAAFVLSIARAPPAPEQPKTGTFLDRQWPTDLRVVSCDVSFDAIFPDKRTTGAQNFGRVVRALDP